MVTSLTKTRYCIFRERRGYCSRESGKIVYWLFFQRICWKNSLGLKKKKINMIPVTRPTLNNPKFRVGPPKNEKQSTCEHSEEIVSWHQQTAEIRGYGKWVTTSSPEYYMTCSLTILSIWLLILTDMYYVLESFKGYTIMVSFSCCFYFNLKATCPHIVFVWKHMSMCYDVSSFRNHLGI